MQIKKSESQEQQTVMAWAEIMQRRYPELQMLFHVPNEGKRSKAAGAQDYPGGGTAESQPGREGAFVSQCDTKEKHTQKTVESEEDTQAQADKRKEETVQAIRVIRRLVAEAVETGKVTKEDARTVRSLLEDVKRVTM